MKPDTIEYGHLPDMPCPSTTPIAGLRLFAGEGSGLFGMYGGGGPLLRAHDKATGEILSEFELPAHQTGVPMTYMHEGVQYIVVAVGKREHSAELVALRLP